MGEVIVVASQKGGVGKTTSVVNLSASLALLNKKVLVIDFDPQANATLSLGIKRHDVVGCTIQEVMLGQKDVKDAIRWASVPNLFILPSTIYLSSMEAKLHKKGEVKLQLSQVVNQLRQDYDFILIDTMPSVGPLTVNALTAANSLLIPVQCEYFALDGLIQLLETIKFLKTSSNVRLQVRGLLPTMYSTQNNLSKQVLEELLKNFSTYTIKDEQGYISIPRLVKIAESPSYGKPIALYDPKSPGNKAYNRLAQYILDNKYKAN